MLSRFNHLLSSRRIRRVGRGGLLAKKADPPVTTPGVGVAGPALAFFDTPTDIIGSGNLQWDNINYILALNGFIKILRGNPGASKVLTSDANGLASWMPSQGLALTLWLYHDASSDIANYYQLLPTQPNQAGAKQHVDSSAVNNGDTVIFNFATEPSSPSLTFINDGTWHFHIHASQTSNKVNVLYVKLYKRDAGGIQTLLFTTEETAAIPTDGAEHEFDIYSFQSEFDLDATDRLVAEYHCVHSGGSSSVITFYMEDLSDARIELPAFPPGTPHDLLDGAVDQDTVAAAVQEGDLIYGNSTPKWDRLAKGTDDYVLTMDPATHLPTWKASGAGGPHDLLDGSTDQDTVAHAVTAGDIIFGNVTPKWDGLAANATATNKFLRSVSGGLPGWEQVDYGDLSNVPSTFAPSAHNILSAAHGDTLADSVVAGDILIGNGTPKWSRLAKGTDNYMLTIDASTHLPAWKHTTRSMVLVVPGNPAAATMVSIQLCVPIAGSNHRCSVNLPALPPGQHTRMML